MDKKAGNKLCLTGKRGQLVSLRGIAVTITSNGSYQKKFVPEHFYWDATGLFRLLSENLNPTTFRELKRLVIRDHFSALARRNGKKQHHP